LSIINARGTVLGGALVTERIMPGALSQDHGARHDPINTTLDRGGSNNLLSPHGYVSQNCLGVVTSGFLVDVAKVDIAELHSQYPEAFKRACDPASGPILDSWLIDS
jgi:trimethylamine-N-oxide reductase (cytochrome c)